MIGHKEFPSRAGGVEVVVAELAAELVKRGHSVTVYDRGRRPGKNRYFCDGVEVIRAAAIRRPGLDAAVSSFTATIHALTRRYDVIHYHALGPSVMLPLARLCGAGTVATVHGLDWKRAKWGRLACAYLKLGERLTARCAGEVVVLSQSAQAYFLRRYGRKTRLIENAVPPVEAAPCREIGGRFGLTAGGYILFVARIVPEKGLHHLILAFLRCGTEKKLVVAGALPDGPYGRYVQELAGGRENILFVGFVQEQILQELYCNCALYVLPSEVEGMALTLLEAMSAGALCLTSDIPENREVLGEFGFVFHSGDVQSLYEVLSHLLAGPLENPRAEEQRRYIRRRYTVAAMVDKTEGAYRAACRPQAGCRR